MSFLRRIYSRFFSSRRPFKLTRGGWVFILYTVGIGAGAINTGNNLLYLIFGLFLGMILASGLLSDLSLWGVEMSWQFPPHARANEPSFIVVDVKNNKRWFPSIATTIEMAGDIHGTPVTLQLFAPSVPPQSHRTFQFVFVPERRGKFVVSYVRLLTRFPFGLLHKWWTPYRSKKLEAQLKKETEADRMMTREEEDLLVYPSLLNGVREALRNKASGQELSTQKNQKGEGSSVFSVREYKPSDNPKRVHWKASAKRSSHNKDQTAHWLVREMESEEQTDVVIQWPDLASFSSLDEAYVEKLIGYTASLIAAFEESDRGVRFLLSNEWEVLDPWPYLALFDHTNPKKEELMALVQKLETSFGSPLDIRAALDAWEKHAA